MTEQEEMQRLADDNSDLRVKLWECRRSQNNTGAMKQSEIYKDKWQLAVEENRKLTDEVKELRKEVKKTQSTIALLKQHEEQADDPTVEVMTKEEVNQKTGNYVKYTKYQKAMKQVSELAGKVRQLNEQLNNKI